MSPLKVEINDKTVLHVGNGIHGSAYTAYGLIGYDIKADGTEGAAGRGQRFAHATTDKPTNSTSLSDSGPTLTVSLIPEIPTS